MLNVSASGFYGWLKAPGGKRGQEDEFLCEQIKKAFDASRETYGSRRIRRELKKLKRCCTLRRVRRLMRKLGLCPKRRRRFRSTTDSKHGFQVYENLLKRDFKVDGPDQVWVSDITYIWTAEGWAVPCERDRPVLSEGGGLEYEREPEGRSSDRRP